MKLLVTGSTGFLGSHFLDRALKQGHDVIALKRLSTSYPKILLTHQPLWLTKSIQELDVTDVATVDTIVHLAACGVSPQIARYKDLVDVNIQSLVHLMELVKSTSCKRIVIAGTSHEYGLTSNDYDYIPSSAALRPITPYGASKAAAFHMAHTFSTIEKIQVYYARIFSLYGLGQNEQNFWPSLRKAAIEGKDFKMTSGSQVTDFMKVEDAIDKLLDSCTRGDLVDGEPFVENIGSGVTSSLLEFAQLQWKKFNATGQLLPNTLPNRQTQIYRCVPRLTI